ncbi:unnamed protein product [Tuber melanosporum]|uniref:(Perigord truffle) hypothetical protein n=1 Tax=Tuber melanosporum (strain Mel28) TaxID=656061 RepID=D5GPX1_TUBMM|nr:uncharacterized protein GSTUM_00012054001 [Tuber melanosporum]CAZ86548.1 unnamed protein product [Tuber melanosporum]
MSGHEDLGPYSESSRSTGTVRHISQQDRTPAEPQTPLASGDASRDVPSSLESFSSAAEHIRTHSPENIASTESRLSRTSSAASSLRGRISSPDRKPRRPSTTRRTSTVGHPHKGQEFSVDDETDEVEEDLGQRHRSATGSTGFSAMRRHSQLLRRRTTPQTALSDVDSMGGEPVSQQGDPPSEEQETEGEEDGEERTVRGGTYEASDAGSVESFTLKDRQEAINVTHPFGIRIWKPALYKKNRSVQRTAEGDIHSAPGGRVGNALFLVNILWVLLFGWWLALASLVAAMTCYLFFFTYSAREYGRVLLGLAGYLWYPFGRFVELKQEEAYAEEDEGEGRSISEYEQWQAGDIEEGQTFFGPHTPRTLVGRRRESLDSVSESDSVLGTGERTGLLSGFQSQRKKRRLFGRGQWNVGRVLFFVWFYFIIAPLLLFVSCLCWLLVFTIPMAKVTALLCDHLRRHPLALSFHSDHTYSRRPGTPSTSILLCTYRAVGWKYYKYTIDGTNIFFINLMMVVFFVIADHYALGKALGRDTLLTTPAMVFTLSLCSVIPLAYFIGQAVASISAQSSMGMGATINAFFSTIVEVYLYCVALKEGKGRLVEGSVVGSILAGVVFMPGLSMCSGAIKRKTQRFNAKSAGVTSTMLLFAVIGVFAPTLFYQIYGTYELACRACRPEKDPHHADCRRNEFYRDAVQPYTYIAAVFLFISYVIGLWFTLRTHAAVIWHSVPPVQPPAQPTHPPVVEPVRGPSSRGHDGIGNQQGYGTTAGASTSGSLRDNVMFKRILGQSLDNFGLRVDGAGSSANSQSRGSTLHVVPPRSADDLLTPSTTAGSRDTPTSHRLFAEENAEFVRSMAEIAAVTTTAAYQDFQRHGMGRKSSTTPARPALHSMPIVEEDIVAVPDAGHGGHDAPNWSRAKSSIILLGATVLYAVIAEILVDTVDVVLENLDIDEKFLGMTLFALVPNTTEFLNAISFAMNGNIALSMEIGSAYALQVCLLQIPALVFFSAFFAMEAAPMDLVKNTFTLIFPQWDVVTVILCVFLLSYMYGEGKSNYFKGSILLLSYLTVMMGFYFSSFAKNVQTGKIIVGAGSKGYGSSNIPSDLL